MKEISKKTIILFCLPQFAVGLFTTMLNNYLIYFYQPTAASGLPTLITQGYVVAGILTVIGLIKALGHVIDAVSDPLVASLSDKSANPQGRRIPFMKRYAIPFAVSALLIFWSPSTNPLFNNVWLAFFIWAYYIFYTLYMIPRSALLPEMIHNEGKLVDAYTWNSLFFVVGNALELLGKYIQREDGSKVEALGLYDTYAVRQTPNRFNSLMRIAFAGMTLLGYTSRFSHTYGLTEEIAMGKVEAGSGENPDSKLEGIYNGNVLATYLSGPVLVANPDFAHWFLKKIGAPAEQLPCEDALRLAYDQRLKDFSRPDLEMA